jgi:hypothetical protein
MNQYKKGKSFYSAIYFAFSIVIYLFSVLVFLPLSKSLEVREYGIIISGLSIIIIGLSFAKGYPFFEYISKILSEMISDWWIDYKQIEVSKKAEVVRNITLKMIIFEIFLFYFLLSPFFLSINPALNGLILFGIILFSTSFYMLANQRK